MKKGGLSILIVSSIFAVLLVLMITFYLNLIYKLHSAEKSSLQSLEKKSRIASKYSGLVVSSDYLVSTRGNITILGIVTSEGFKKLNITGQRFSLKYLRQIAKSNHFIVMTSSGPIEINYELMSEDYSEGIDLLHVLTNHWVLTKLPVEINPYCVVKVRFSKNLGQNFKLLVYAIDHQWSYFMMYSVTRSSPLEVTTDSSLMNYHVDVFTPE
ncbi:MAG: hypothetical protein B6V02_03705 [Thermoprotei archaeon ex4572_64]|nr:MAG: hypothetical protein B6V02_03705 [Thermoprotei archaeon ex4572_64]